MSSLLQTASPWSNDESSQIKKRISTMKNTIKKVQSNNNSSQLQSGVNDYKSENAEAEDKPVINEYYYMQSLQGGGGGAGAGNISAIATRENFQNAGSTSGETPANIEQSQQVIDKRASTITDLLNTIGVTSGGSGDGNSGSNLANFNPPPPPVLTKSPAENGAYQMNPVELFPKASQPPSRQQPANMTMQNFQNYTAPNNQYLGTNYNTVYSKPITDLKNTPYYAKMGIGAGGGGGGGGDSDKLMERLNYMIHLLEQQQNDKTANVLEETILYAMLGIFVIFVVDAFSRNGKYVR